MPDGGPAWVNGDRLVIHVRDAPLGDVLRLIARRTGVGVVAEGDLDVRVTATLEGVAIDDAVARLARGHATVRLIARSVRPDEQADRLRGIEVSRATVEPLDIVRALALPAGDPLRRPALDRLLADSADPVVRARVVAALATERDPHAIATLLRALGDQAVRVRIQAVYALRQAGGVATVGTLAKLLATEMDHRVRIAAARALSFLPGAEAAAAVMRASGDEHPAVRREASRAAVPPGSR